MIVNVLSGSFGVTGDGVANDGPALQRAINYAAVDGYDLLLPAGTYRVPISDSAPALRLHGGVTLYGEGPKHTRIVGDGAAGAMLNAADSGGLCSVTLDGPTAPTSSTIGLLHSGSGAVRLEDVATAHWTHAVKADGGGSLDLDGCAIRASSVCVLVIDAEGAPRLHVRGGTMGVDWTGMLTSLEGGAAAVDPQHCVYVGESVNLLVDGLECVSANDACIKILRNRGDLVVPRAAEYVTITRTILRLRNARPSYTVGVRSSGSTRTVLSDVTIVGEHDTCVGIQLCGDVEASNVRFVDGAGLGSGQWYCLVQRVADASLDMRGGSADVTCSVALWWQETATTQPWRVGGGFVARMRERSTGNAWRTPSGVMYFDGARIHADGCDSLASQGGGELHAHQSRFTSATRGAFVTATTVRLEDVDWSSASDAGLMLTSTDAKGARVMFSGQQQNWPALGAL